MTVTADQQVTLSIYEYLELLCQASETDPEKWPEGLKEGATLLARIREIEAHCRAEHGEWDWELISEELQDEYDAVSGRLSLMRDSLNPLQTKRLLSDVLDELDLQEANQGNGKQR